MFHIIFLFIEQVHAPLSKGNDPLFKVRNMFLQSPMSFMYSLPITQIHSF